jgi:hypothetical protein
MLKTSTPKKSVLAGSGLTQLLQEACKDPLTAGRSIYNKISGSTATRHLSARSTRSLPAKTICILLRRLQLIPANRTRSNDRLPGQTFVGGATIQSSLKSNLYAPGYQYDTIRRKRWTPWTRSAGRPLCCFGEDQCDAPNRQWRAVRNGERMVARPDPRGWARIPPLPDQLANFLWKATSTGCTSAGTETLSRRSIRLGGF